MARVINTINKGGGGTTITVVANYDALPDPTTVSGKFYWCSASQGTKWLPGSIGGTYYSAGQYYSNGTTWEFIDVPYQATQEEVDAGTVTDKFVTPKTLNDGNFLKRDGSNAGANLDLGGYDILANSLITQTNGSAKRMILKSSNVNSERNAEWQDIDYIGIEDISNKGDVIGNEASTNIYSHAKGVVDYVLSLSYITASYVTSALASFKTTEHLDATSSIQGQLNSKQPLLSYTPYRFFQVSQTAHTGTILETIVATATINGGTFNTSDLMRAIFKATKASTTSNVTMRLRINTSNSLSGATTIATLTFTTANLFAQMKRTFDLQGGNLYAYNFASSIASDDLGTNTGGSSTAYNTANTLYMFWTLQLGTSGDSVTPNLANLTN